MPVGVLVDCTAIVFGGLIGACGHNRIPERIKVTLPVIFATCALALGITLIVKVINIEPVVLALILGTAVGERLGIEDYLNTISMRLQRRLQSGATRLDEKAVEDFVTLLVLFSANAGCIIGALYEGMTGDTTLLVIKSILDFFTAMIFATTAGYLIVLLSIPTLVVGVVFFSLASIILPHISEVMIADFVGGGGIITLLVGIRMMGLKRVPVANTIPVIPLLMPLSYLWTLVF
ncbi:MAG: DUF554 domain-containing protein [Firmicutes bacterium]|jgi:uncharacterized membrane protein YqgA involved in biofilm formation|nr:DUF554 domain-containing protein [Bacillota bacterium]MDH7495690.1 DUF554 domain-containing protein [Bacillota bacterium]